MRKMKWLLCCIGIGRNSKSICLTKGSLRIYDLHFSMRRSNSAGEKPPQYSAAGALYKI
jgi:hypothetical protein